VCARTKASADATGRSIESVIETPPTFRVVGAKSETDRHRHQCARSGRGGMFVLPSSTPPAARIRSTANESSFATSAEKAGEPAARVSPRALKLSLTVNGTPCSGPSTVPAARSRSASAASASADGFSTGTELSRMPVAS
jgi:hypothetical protein